MTPARTHAQGLVTPSLSQLWLAAMLRLFAELVQNVVSTLGMAFRRKQRDWHTCAAPEALPPMKSDIVNQETEPAGATSIDRPVALMLSSERSSRPSKHEGVLAAAVGCISAQRVMHRGAASSGHGRRSTVHYGRVYPEEPPHGGVSKGPNAPYDAWRLRDLSRLIAPA